MAKLLLTSDWHLRETTPIGRIDDFQEVMWNKLSFLLKTALDEAIDVILQAGDFFDKPNPSFSLLNKLIGLLYSFDISIMSICGQHDLYMRNQDTDKTAFGLLDRVQLLSDVGRTKPFQVKNCFIYGCRFGEELEDWGARAGEFSILLIHDMIGDKPLYPGHEITDAGKFLAEHPEYQIILCGDYHYPFHIRRGNRHILNTGCMLRMTRDERDMNRTPHFYIVDTETNEWKKYDFPCEPLDKVFASKKDVPETIATNEGDLLRFIEKLKKKGKSGISYMSVLNEYCKEHDISKSVVELIKEVL